MFAIALMLAAAPASNADAVKALITAQGEAWNRGETPPTDNDGIVTAEEVGGLKLDGTWLVVLSACDTGIGEVCRFSCAAAVGDTQHGSFLLQRGDDLAEALRPLLLELGGAGLERGIGEIEAGDASDGGTEVYLRHFASVPGLKLANWVD